MANGTLLRLNDVSKHFGGLVALSDVTFALKKGEFLGVIGPNGAGKTTMFNVITGVYPVTKGTIFLLDEDVTHVKTHNRARKGIVRSFQQVNVFSRLTALENLFQGFHIGFRVSFLDDFFSTRRAQERIAQLKAQALDLLHFLELERFKDEMAGSLPLGVQKKLGIAVALAADPKVLLLDEPVSGLNPVEIESVMHFIAETVRKKCTCVIIEHHVKTVMDYCDRIIVLNFGRKIAEGLPRDIAKDPQVIGAYLGEE